MAKFTMDPTKLMSAGAPTTPIVRPADVELKYDYEQIEGATQAQRETLMANTIEIKRADASVNQAVWELGGLLAEQREIFVANGWHGHWMKWLATETQYSHDMAARLINYHRRFEDANQFKGLSMSALLLLGKPSTPDAVVDSVATQIASGTPPTYKQVEKEIADAKRAMGGFDNEDDLKPLNTKLPPAISPAVQRQLDAAAAKAMYEEYNRPEPAPASYTNGGTRTAPVVRTPVPLDEEIDATDDPTVEIYLAISSLRDAISAARKLEMTDPQGVFVNGRDVANLISAAQVLINKAESMLDA